jgi:hypothetical protein
MALVLPRSLCDALAPHVGTSLIAPPQWQALTAVIARLPPVFSSGIFECRLHREPRVDLLVCLARRTGGAVAAPRRFPAPIQREALAPILPFLDAWYDDPRLAPSPLLWIEHDLLPEGASPPFVQFCVDPSYPRSDQLPRAPAAVGALAAAGVERLLGHAASPGALARLVQAAEQLPAGGRILHVGVIPHRGSEALRVLAAVPVDETLAWLESVGWPGDFARAAELLALLGTHFRRASVQLDLGEQIGPTMAIEFPRVAESGADPAWQTFMDALVERGLAEPHKARAALAWIGYQTDDLPGAAWLVGISRQLDVKLSLGRESCEAKAYLAFHPHHVPL